MHLCICLIVLGLSHWWNLCGTDLRLMMLNMFYHNLVDRKVADLNLFFNFRKTYYTVAWFQTSQLLCALLKLTHQYLLPSLERFNLYYLFQEILATCKLTPKSQNLSLCFTTDNKSLLLKSAQFEAPYSKAAVYFYSGFLFN